MDAANAQAPAYDFVHKTLHWLIFALVVAQYTAGFVMPDITSLEKVEGAWIWHLAVGPTILFLVILKLAWRIARPVPLPTDIPVWQRTVASWTHGALYVLLLVIPILGWAMASSQSMEVKLFGLITLPAIAPKLAPWADTAGNLHIFLVYVLLAVLVLHAAAALYHYFVRRDRVMQRMLP